MPLRNPSRDKLTGEREKIVSGDLVRVRGKCACGFSGWRVRAWHNPKRLLRVYIHAKGGEFSTMGRPLTFPGAMVDMGFGRL